VQHINKRVCPSGTHDMSLAKMFYIALSFLITLGLSSVFCQLCNRPSNDQIKNGIIKSICSTRGCSLLTIKCDRCFKQVGEERIRCVGGKWAAINSRCVPTLCEPLKLTAGIAASSDSTHCGAVVKLKCVKGYEPTKAIKMACEPTGKWKGTRLKCTKSKKKCPDLVLPKNARVVAGRLAGNRAGDSTVFECEERYEQIAGSRVVKCLNGGRWNGSLIECKDLEPVDCVWGPWSKDTKCTCCDECCFKYCLRYRKKKPAHDGGRDCVGQSTDYVIRKCDKKECAKTWEKPKRCWGWGDVHYHSFDDLEYNFQGVCKYTLVEDTIGFFKVFVKNRQWGNRALSVTQYVEIHLAGDIIRLDGPGSIQVKVNGIPLPPESLPYNTQWYTANVVGNTTTFESTPLTLRIQFNIHHGYGDVYITLGRQWMQMVDGLCKNYDDNTPNDCTDKAGTDLLGNPNKGKLLGISYKVPDPQDPDCVDMLRTSGPTCPAQTKAAANKFCGSFVNDIAVSMTKAEIKTWVDNCIMDYCAAPDAKCDIMEAFFVAIRRGEGQDIMEEWRKIFKCPRQCGLNEVYLYDGPGCEPHCVESELRWCAEHRREGCFCKPGYIRCKGKCIIPTGCHWSTWGSWQYGSCSKTCGTGRKDRIRTRTKQPVGSGCLGVSVETGYVDCSNPPCCHWSAWGSWQYGSCSKTCGTGRKNRQRTRTKRPGGSGCPGLSIEKGYVECRNTNSFACGCHWSAWGSWQYRSCSKTCGTGGRKYRSRTRSKLPGGSGCPGVSVETGYVDCSNPPCCHWSKWSSWSSYGSCSSTCGAGRQDRRRTRRKLPGGSGCPGLSIEEEYVICLYTYNPACERLIRENPH
ncbi:unnamed protein product, partial [Owenia fusiformis]